MTGLEALNIVGFTATDLKRASLDILLGTTFWTASTEVSIKAEITNSLVTAAGAVLVAATSKGVASATVSNVSRAQTVGMYSIQAKTMSAIIASNQMNRAARAVIQGGATYNDVTAGGAVEVEASDDSTIHSNVKMASAAIAASDGGLHNASRLIDLGINGDYGVTQGTLAGGLAYGKKVDLDWDTVTNGFKGKITVNTGDIVLRSSQGGAGQLFKYLGDGPVTIDFESGDPLRLFTTTGADPDWQAISGKPGTAYTFMGQSTGPNYDLAAADYANPDLWKADLDFSVITDTHNLRAAGASAMGAVIVLNDLRGGATALIDAADVDAGSISVIAESTGTIEAFADVTNDVKGGAPNNQDALLEKALGKASFFFKAGGSNATSAVVATNLIQGATSAKITGGTIDGIKAGANSGNVTVRATNSSTITAETATVAMSTGTGKAAAFQIAHNTIGYERTNVLFNTVENLVGAPLTSENAFIIEASITNSAVNAGAGTHGAVAVDAISDATISARISNEASGAVVAIVDGAQTGYGAVISGNKISSGAKAFVNGGSVVGSSVAVKAQDTAEIDANTGLGVSATTENTAGVDVVNKIIDNLMSDYAYTTASGSQSLTFGAKVRVSDTYSGLGTDGAVYQYMGADDVS